MLTTQKSSKPTTETLLPPPCAYEELYSSYQNEWDQKKSSKQRDWCNDFETTNFDNSDVDESVSDLKWVTVSKSLFLSNESRMQKENGDESETYLLACTGSGEIVVWKLEQERTATDINKTMDALEDSTDLTILLVPRARWKISQGDHSTEDSGDDESDVGDRDDRALFQMCIVSAIHPDNSNVDTAGRTRIRKRPRLVDNKSQIGKNEQQQLLIVAGEDGLWSIPLSEILIEQQPQSASRVSSPQSLLRLSDRSISQLQSLLSTWKTVDVAGNNHHNWLFALEKYTNNLLLWDLGKILQSHNESNKSHSSDWTALAEEIDLTRCFLDKPPPKSKERRRLIQKSVGIGEFATNILVSRSDNKLNLLVGTDRSNVWILSLLCSESNDVPSIGRDKPRFFSLKDVKNASRDRASNATNRQHGSNKNRSSLVVATSNQHFWKVSDIIETNDGTWWTAAAVRSGSIDDDNNNNNNSLTNSTAGLLVTWHASSGMVVARRETREAIQAIRQQQQLPQRNSPSVLYSTGNEAAVTTWDSSISFKRTGRFWASSPSSKAIAIAAGTTRMAVAGVGNRVDLFVDHCRVQTVRI